MKRSIAALVILFSLSASCALPNLAGQPLPPTSEPWRATMSAQTAAALPTNAYATGTPTPTAMPPSTAEGGEASAYGSTLEKQADGSTLFTDSWAGYQVVIPAGWVTVRPNHPEYYDVWANETIAHPELTAELEVIEGQDPRVMRLHAFDIQPDHQQDKYVAHIYIIAITNRAVDLKADVDANLDLERQRNPRLRVLVAGKQQVTSTNIPFLKLEYEAPVLNMRYEDIEVHDQRIFFYADQTSVSISLSMLTGVKDELLPAFEAMIDQMILLPRAAAD